MIIRSADWSNGYELGYRDGAASAMDEWHSELVLENVLPDGVKPLPSVVAKYIRGLHAALSGDEEGERR